MMDLIDDIVNLFKSLLDYLGIDANNLVSKQAYHFGSFPTTIFCPKNVVCFLCLLHIFKCTSGLKQPLKKTKNWFSSPIIA